MDLSRYLGMFVADTREHLAGVEADVVRLETAAPAERKPLLDGVFRHLHSVKGSSATMGYDAIAKLSHASEALVGAVRDAGRLPAPPEVDLLLETCDQLRSMVDDASEGRSPAARPALQERLLAAAKAKDARAPAPAGTPAAPSPAAPATARRRFTEPHTTVAVRVSTRSATPAARAFLALRRLETVAPVLEAQPSLEALREGRLPGHLLVVTLKGEHALEALAKLIARVPDVDGLEPFADEAVAPAGPAAEPAPAAPAVHDPTVKVAVDLLDQLLELAGELVLASGRLREAVKPLPAGVRGELDGEVDRLRLLVKDLNNRVLAARQTPLSHVAERLPRAVRDLSRRLDKPLELLVEGGEVMLDRGLADALLDPLLHAIRNAADHGIEQADERRALGKPATGRIVFAARRERDRVLIELTDDGRGFDVERLKAKAVEQGQLPAAEAQAMGVEQALRLAFLPGLSTRDASTDVSGRGVGMDAVLRAIEQLGGTVALVSTPGRGSTVRFAMPATISVVNLLLVALGGEVFGVPMSRVLCALEADLSARGGEGYAARSVPVNGERVPSFALGKLLGLPEHATYGPRPYVVVEGEGLRTAVGVDRLLGQEEVVLRPLGPPLERIRGLAGTAILGSGRPIFVLDVPRLVA